MFNSVKEILHEELIKKQATATWSHEHDLIQMLANKKALWIMDDIKQDTKVQQAKVLSSN
jgi:hypothetical protein